MYSEYMDKLFFSTFLSSIFHFSFAFLLLFSVQVKYLVFIWVWGMLFNGPIKNFWNLLISGWNFFITTRSAFWFLTLFPRVRNILWWVTWTHIILFLKRNRNNWQIDWRLEQSEWGGGVHFLRGKLNKNGILWEQWAYEDR